MADIIVEYAKLSEEEQQRQRDFYEEIRKHDEATALAYARQQGYAIGFAESKSELIAKLIEISVDELMSKEKAKNRTDAIAEGLAEGIAEGKKILCSAIAQSLRKNGFTEKQIKLALGDSYNG